MAGPTSRMVGQGMFALPDSSDRFDHRSLDLGDSVVQPTSVVDHEDEAVDERATAAHDDTALLQQRGGRVFQAVNAAGPAIADQRANADRVPDRVDDSCTVSYTHLTL